LAGAANAKDFQKMSMDLKSALVHQMAFDILHHTGVHFDHGMTSGTNQMVMMSVHQKYVVCCTGSLIDWTDKP
jgi:hypothetical protein